MTPRTIERLAVAFLAVAGLPTYALLAYWTADRPDLQDIHAATVAAAVTLAAVLVVGIVERPRDRFGWYITAAAVIALAAVQVIL